MATKRWRGDAVPVAQVTGWTFGGTWEADDLVTVTINGKVVSVTAGSTTIATVVDNVVAALNALDPQTYPEFSEAIASRSGTTDLRLTARNAGIPFTATLATTEANGSAADSQTIGSATTVTANSGPNDWGTAANWSSSGVPSSSDDVVIESSDIDILYNLDQNSVTLTSLTIPASYTGKIGLPEKNLSGYYEYRDTYLKISATTVTIGDGPGAGSGRIKINTGSVQTSFNVHGSGQPVDGDGTFAVYWRGTHSSNAVEITKGIVGVAALASETANVSGGFKVGFVSNRDGDSTVYCGSGVTFATVTQSGGTVTTQSAVTTYNKDGGVLFQLSGTITTHTDYEGTTYCMVSGTAYTTVNVGSKAKLDLSRDPSSKTWTTCNLYAGAELYDPTNTSGNSPFKTVKCSLEDVKVNQGKDKTFTPS